MKTPMITTKMSFTLRASTLLEVLLSLVVLSIGVLGMARLQLLSMVNTQQAYLHTQAIFLASDLAQSIMANPQAIESRSLAEISDAMHINCSVSQSCGRSQAASNELSRWQQSVADTLPSGKAVVCIDKTPFDGSSVEAACDMQGNSYVIKIWWDGSRNGTVSSQHILQL